MRANDSRSDNVIAQPPTAEPISAGRAAERADQSDSARGGHPKQKLSTTVAASRQVRALRVNDAAAIYGISRSTLYKMMARFDRGDRSAGGLPALRYVQIGGHRLLPVDALEALIAGEGV
jgi:hypothetical protein